MNLHLYSDELFSIQIDMYELGNTPYAGTPKKVIEECATDKNKFAIAVSDDVGKLVGFLCIHVGNGPEAYGYHGEKYALLRNISIDERYRGKGYGVKCFEKIFDFIHQEINPKITSLILGVNEKNIPAQKAYEKADFKRREGFVIGRLGNLIIMEKQKRTA